MPIIFVMQGKCLFQDISRPAFRYLLLLNQKVNGLGTWYIALGMWALSEVCTNDESGLTLICITARPNLITNAFTVYWKNLEMFIFLLSKATHIELPYTYLSIFF